MARTSILALTLATAAFAVASLTADGARTQADFDPLGQQDLIVIPIEHTVTPGLKGSDCVHEPLRKDYPSDAAWKKDHDTYLSSSLPQWNGYIATGFAGVRKTAAQWGAFISTNVNAFYKGATYGQTSWRVHMVIDPATAKTGDGWWPAAHTLAQYCAQWKAGGAHPISDPNGTVRDAIEVDLAKAAASDPTLLTYDRVMVIQNAHFHGGLTNGPPGVTYTLNTGSTSMTKAYTVSLVNEEASDSLAANTHSHELGHQLGLHDYYGCAIYAKDTNTDCAGDWDIMGGLTNSKLSQFNGYSRLAMGWMTPTGKSYGRTYDTPYVYTDSSYWSHSYGLHPLEDDGFRNVARVVRIPFAPFTSDTFHGYMLECRRKLAGDQIPAEGMVVRFVDEGDIKLRPQRGYTVRVVDDHNPNVPMTVYGQQFHVNLSTPGAPRYLAVHFNGFTGDLCSVTVTKDETKPSPLVELLPGYVVKQNVRVPAVRSPDIWVDSKKNGWQSYPAAQHTTRHQGVAVPDGGGDEAWPGHPNRIYFRVHNLGDAAARRVQVTVSVSSTLAVPGCARPPGQPALTKTIAEIKPGSDAIAYVPWRPSAATTAQIQVEIAALRGEQLNDSHAAASTSAVVTHRLGRAQPQSFVLPVTLGSSQNCGVVELEPQAVDVPAGWQISFSPPYLPASANKQRFRVQLTPPRNAKRGQQAEILIGLAASYPPFTNPQYPITAVPPFQDTIFELLSGLHVTVHLT